MTFVDTNERFSRIRLLLGQEKLDRLARAKVTVIGLGAVGAQAAEAMARCGVGCLRLVDFDIIRPSNINRHIWATDMTVGQSKSSVACARLPLINPKMGIESLEMFSAEETLGRILDNRPDMVIDAIDSLNPKIQTLLACYQNNLPVVSSMGAATRTDPSQIRIADLFSTQGCPLAARVRRRLKDRGVGKGITCVYSQQYQDVQHLSQDQPRDIGEYPRGRERRTLGSLPTITGIFGLTVAHVALERLCGGWVKPCPECLER
ncbi:MAG: tRNA threonylcarbamoyladenosine dehydratase [Candidatus Omnitrophota bacterium]